jgi:hypothetical protein
MQLNVYTTNCNHVYCRDCIEKWFAKGKKTCPMCQQDIASYTYNHQLYKLVFKEINNQPPVQNLRNLTNNPPQSHVLVSSVTLKTLKSIIYSLMGICGLFSLSLISIINERDDLKDNLDAYSNDLIDVRICPYSRPVFICKIAKYIIDNCQ